MVVVGLRLDTHPGHQSCMYNTATSTSPTVTPLLFTMVVVSLHNALVLNVGCIQYGLCSHRETGLGSADKEVDVYSRIYDCQINSEQDPSNKSALLSFLERISKMIT